jgi:L-cysteine S-thiosulfotransferase
MKKLTQLITAVVLFSLLLSTAYADSVAEGKELSFDRKKGNCLACHMMDDGELPGLVGPPLMMMEVRFPDRAVLREQIWDATIRNPATSMPPFGKHRMMTEEEIDKVVDYLYTL